MKPLRTAESLGIHLAPRKESELFKWFLASLLYGKPIQREIAEQAILARVKASLLSGDACERIQCLSGGGACATASCVISTHLQGILVNGRPMNYVFGPEEKAHKYPR